MASPVGLVLASAAACLLLRGSALRGTAGPADTVAARDRDEDVRIERFLPPLAALAGGLGVVWASRRGNHRTATRIAATAAILATSIGPLVTIGPRPLNRQPSPDAQEYADATRHLAAGDGYVMTIYGGQPRAARYPPGFSLALTPFALIGSYPVNVQAGSKAYAILYVVATLVTGWIVGGPLAAAIGVALVGDVAVRRALRVAGDVRRVRGVTGGRDAGTLHRRRHADSSSRACSAVARRWCGWAG